ncbi:MAG: ABC transporter ATP-binding protein [Spirochaetes bacterium]|nr:ABC transporter ATP-binding protein [Spirochaetota bacterium]
MGSIVLDNIQYAYGEYRGLDGVSASINAGASVAVIGPNGSGKSTLLKIINGLLVPSGGTYTFDGERIDGRFLKDAKRAKRFHQRIGFVFQNSDTQLFSPTVYEEIAFGPRQMGLSDDEVHKRVLDCLSLLAIDRLKHREPHHLSEGEKKKVAIAAVLSLNPEVLVLDEPMDGLDPKTKGAVREVLITLNRSGKCIIGATHEFDYVKGVFSRALVLSGEHTVVREGNFETIVRNRAFLRRHNIL